MLNLGYHEPFPQARQSRVIKMLRGGGVVMVLSRHSERRFELRATARGLEIPVFSHIPPGTQSIHSTSGGHCPHCLP